jgi:hypothetical protein
MLSPQLQTWMRKIRNESVFLAVIPSKTTGLQLYSKHAWSP